MTSKFQKNICFKTRAAGLINIKTKECKIIIIIIIIINLLSAISQWFNGALQFKLKKIKDKTKT